MNQLKKILKEYGPLKMFANNWLDGFDDIEDDDILDELDKNGYIDFSKFKIPSVKEQLKKKLKCECGVDKAGGGKHSDYCPKYEKENE